MDPVMKFLESIRKKYGQVTSTNTASTSNVRSRSVKSKAGTKTRPQKRTASHSREGKSMKRLKLTSTTDESYPIGVYFVPSTPKLNINMNMDEPSRLRSSITGSVQNELQTGQNRNNVRNDLVEYSVMTIREPFARNRRGRNNSTRLNNDNIIIISEDDDDSDIEVIDSSSTSFIHRRTIKNNRKERTNQRKRNNKKYPETTITNTVTINEEESDSLVEVSSEGLPSCPICFETLKGKEISVTTCGHAFCKECIMGAIATCKKCPTCRTSLTDEQIHPLFI